MITRWLLIALAACVSASGLENEWESQARAASNASLLWVQRPNLYFGMRTRQPDTLEFGLIWFGLHDFQSVARPRHACDQDDGLDGYAWTKHDGREAGTQVLKDPSNNVELTTEFLKTPGGAHGGSWAARISGKPLDPARPSRVSIIPYFGVEASGSLQLDSAEDEEGIEGPVELSGSTNGLGDFGLRIVEGATNRSPTRLAHAEDFGDKIDRFQYFGAPIPAGQIWRAKDYIVQDFGSNVEQLIERYGRESPPDPAILYSLTNDIRTGATVFAFQKTFEGPFSFDIYFDSGSMPSKLEAAGLSAGLQASKASFDDRFETTFGLAGKGFDAKQIETARQLTASIIGGIGYFYGSSIVDRSFTHSYDDPELALSNEGGSGRDPNPQLTEPGELFTATPSRSFFPRGFYWDEGFHLLLIGAWDSDLSLEILRDWVNLIDEDGWVGREQILGEEARSKVPQQFWTQYPHYANPPTLTMAVTSFISRLRKQGISGIGDVDLEFDNERSRLQVGAATSDASQLANRHLQSPQLARAYLQSVYPALRRHYEWFRRTQRGQISEWGRQAKSRTEAYRWRGRTAEHVLTSGLDDYPRANPPHVGELHVDLISWMAFFTRTMSEIAKFLGEEGDRTEYEYLYEAILANLDDLHWSEKDQMYCDASVDEDDESYHVCHKGYISLFPLLLGLLPPDSPRIGPLLDLLHDPEHVWSPYGIRSLSKQSTFFGQGENYWRGPIWLPMNYMALQSLHNIYAAQPGPHQQRAQQIYDQLRQNVISNVLKEYERTGYAWEQYNALTGEGQRTKPFTGWTSLVTLIMAEQYL